MQRYFIILALGANVLGFSGCSGLPSESQVPLATLPSPAVRPAISASAAPPVTPAPSPSASAQVVFR